jgi:hypothetical protein
MRKFFMAVGLIAALAIPVAATAAELSNGSGQTCSGGAVGTWHFVNNQTGGAAAGTLTATFSTPTGTFTVGPTAVNSKTQHFYVFATGTLATATTNLPGRLLLSDFTCDHTPKK